MSLSYVSLLDHMPFLRTSDSISLRIHTQRVRRAASPSDGHEVVVIHLHSPI